MSETPSIITPLVTQLGVGGIGGLCVGYALKKVAKIVAFILGISFLGLQYLAYEGIISINYGSLEVWANNLIKGAGVLERVLIAGATGYLGQYIIQELKKKDFYTIALARDIKKLKEMESFIDKYLEAEVTKPATLRNVCENVDYVISSIGITRQKDGLTYMDVDYKANSNLLKEAQAK